MVLPNSHRISRVPWYLGFLSRGPSSISSTGLSPSMEELSSPFDYEIGVSPKSLRRPPIESRYLPYTTLAGYHVYEILALPLSLATTEGISIDFSS